MHNNYTEKTRTRTQDAIQTGKKMNQQNSAAGNISSEDDNDTKPLKELATPPIIYNPLEHIQGKFFKP